MKLQPSGEQSDVLLRALETANSACNRLSQLAFQAGEFRCFPLHGLFYKTLRQEFPLSAQVVVRLNAKVADAYKLGFVCGDRQREILALHRGETDLVLRNDEWYLFATADIPGVKEKEALGWIGVDLGIVNIAHTSDGVRFSGGHLNGLRVRHRRLRRKLQTKGTRAAKRLLRLRLVERGSLLFCREP